MTRQPMNSHLSFAYCSGSRHPPSHPNLETFLSLTNRSTQARNQPSDSLSRPRRSHVSMALQVRTITILSVSFIDIQAGTGKTHTLIEIIRQLTSNPPDQKPIRVLVCGASNLSVDNILERLLALPPLEKGKGTPLKVTRIGHPARVMAREDVLDATLEVKAGRSDQVHWYLSSWRCAHRHFIRRPSPRM